MKLIVQPEDGVEPLLSAIQKAKKSIDLTIFRLDREEIEAALKTAVRDGVRVRALIASINRGGEKNLRKLEMRLLAAGVIVARTDDDLIRYHDKLLIIDGRWLHLLSFNYTELDIEQSRGFGIVTDNPRLVREGIKLFEADCARQPYRPGLNDLVVSPGSSRKTLAALLKSARKQLLIYDPKISDKEMIRILKERAREGVEIKVIGRVGKGANLAVSGLNGKVLHTRTIICDGRRAFIGSQSLRPAELDSRREVGVIVRNAQIVKRLVDTFNEDWAAARMPPAQAKAVEAVVRELEPLTASVKEAVKEVVAKAGDEVLGDERVKDEVKTTVRKAIKKAVKQAVDEVVEDAKEPKEPKESHVQA
jgi:phosphatidylserine/phosphatidylglycerophosphate/cardiolipin synthase-like enzyme